MKGGESEFELYVTTPQNSLSRSGQPIAQVLTEGTPEEILKLIVGSIDIARHLKSSLRRSLSVMILDSRERVTH